MSTLPNDPWPLGSPTPTAAPPASSPASAAAVTPAAPKPSVAAGCVAALAILLLAGNLGLGVYREFHARPAPGPAPAPAPPLPPDPIADIRPKLLADGIAHGQDLARSFGQSLQDAAAQIDGKTPLATIQAQQAAAWQAKRKQLFDARFAATLESIVPAATSKPTQAQIDRYKAALGAIGQGAIKASGHAQ